MSVEAKIRKAETKDILINEYLDVDEGEEFKITIRKHTVKQQMELRDLVPDPNKTSWDTLVKIILMSTVQTPFESWDEEKIKWLDEVGAVVDGNNLIAYLFGKIMEFNRPLAVKNK